MASEQNSPRLLVLGAHPDDAEFHTGGLIATYAHRGYAMKLVSVTDGGAGHHRMDRTALVQRRRTEAAQAGAVVGAPYETWDFPDGYLQSTFEVRDRIIREIRSFRADLVLTHRPCDYHPDHRAVGQAVQDASYLITVPSIAADVPHLRRDPVVAYMPDLFTRPYPLIPHVVRDIETHLDTIVEMLACHCSQVFEWLPYNHRFEAFLPEDPGSRRQWLRQWYSHMIAARADRFRSAIADTYGAAAPRIQFVEAYEISEYATQLAPEEEERLFPR